MQRDISLMMSHINSYSKEKLNDKSLYNLFGFLYGYDILEKLNIHRILATDIVLNLSLLKK